MEFILFYSFKKNIIDVMQFFVCIYTIKLQGVDILKNAGLAAVLSFFVAGLGQIYNGQIGKGIGFIVAYFISGLLMLVIIGFITTPILWIWGMVDAYNVATRINEQQSR